MATVTVLPSKRKSNSALGQFLELLHELFNERRVNIPLGATIHLCGGDETFAILLLQILYWTGKSWLADGWLHKSYDDWSRELGLSEKKVSRPVRWMRSQGFLATKLQRVHRDRILHYQIDLPKLKEWVKARVADLDPTLLRDTGKELAPRRGSPTGNSGEIALLPAISTLPGDTDAEQVVHSISTAGATVVPGNQTTGSTSEGYRWCVAKWNELVPSRTVRHIAAYAKEAAFKDPVVVGAWEEICQNAAAKIDQLDATAGEDSGWLTLEWVVGEKNNKPNWRKMLVQQEWKKRGGVPTFKDGKLVL